MPGTWCKTYRVDVRVAIIISCNVIRQAVCAWSAASLHHAACRPAQSPAGRHMFVLVLLIVLVLVLGPVLALSR